MSGTALFGWISLSRDDTDVTDFINHLFVFIRKNSRSYLDDIQYNLIRLITCDKIESTGIHQDIKEFPPIICHA